MSSSDPSSVQNSSPPPPAEPGWLTFARLVRLPALPTALADILAGFFFVGGTLATAGPLVLLIAASWMLYWAGMILNDVYDVEHDRQYRPERPIPSGAFPLELARRIGFLLLVLGVVTGWMAGYVGAGESTVDWRSGAIASLLAAAVLFYDALLKHTPLGCWTMGLCRMLNLLLGMSIATVPAAGGLAGFSLAQWGVAGGIGFYIAGLTWIARDENGNPRSGPLLGGTVVMVAGLALLAAFPYLGSEQKALWFPFTGVWPFMLALIAFPVVRRAITCVIQPSGYRVRMAVRLGLISLIFLDAALAMAVAGPEAGLIVLALLVPALLAGRWIALT